MSEIYNSKILKYFIYFISSLLFVLLFSITLSPLYQNIYGNDSAIFQIIGKSWSEGFIPYIDTFDHKGPYIFFIDMLGYAITGNKYGLLLIQILNFFVYSIIIDIMVKHFIKTKNNILTIILTVFITWTVCISYDGGNLTEEYLLPIISLSMFGIFIFFENCEKLGIKNIPSHNYKWAFIYGVAFGLSFLTRITNSIGICCGVFIITILLILSKQWQNLIHNIIYFIFGFLICTLPFIIYFASKNALYDMLYGTIIYNIEYAKNSSDSVDLIRSLRWISKCFFAYGIICSSSLLIFKKKFIIGFSSLFIGTITFLMFISGQRYLHYTLIAAPYYVFIISQFIDVFDKTKFKKLAVFFTIFMCGISTIYRILDLKLGNNEYYTSELETYKKLLDNVDDKNNFIGYNASPSIYLKYDIAPSNKYFILQDWQGKKSPILMEKIYNSFNEKNIDWILVSKPYDSNETIGIQNLLDEKYYIYDEADFESHLILYKLK